MKHLLYTKLNAPVFTTRNRLKAPIRTHHGRQYCNKVGNEWHNLVQKVPDYDTEIFDSQGLAEQFWSVSVLRHIGNYRDGAMMTIKQLTRSLFAQVYAAIQINAGNEMKSICKYKNCTANCKKCGGLYPFSKKCAGLDPHVSYADNRR